jgi:hypothetical protein
MYFKTINTFKTNRVSMNLGLIPMQVTIMKLNVTIIIVTIHKIPANLQITSTKMKWIRINCTKLATTAPSIQQILNMPERFVVSIQ